MNTDGCRWTQSKLHSVCGWMQPEDVSGCWTFVQELLGRPVYDNTNVHRIEKGVGALLCVSTVTVITVVSQKRAHGRSTLQVRQRGGWALFRLFPHLTMKERPRHVYIKPEALEANNWTQNNV